MAPPLVPALLAQPSNQKGAATANSPTKANGRKTIGKPPALGEFVD